MEARVTDVYEFGLKPREALRRLGWSSFGIAASRGKGVLTLPLALWLLGPGGYGLVTVALATSGIIASLSLLNIPDGAGRLVVSAPSSHLAERRLAVIRRLGVLGGIALVVIGSAAGLVFHSEIVAWSFAVAAATVFFKVASVHLEYFQLTKRLVRFQLTAEYVSVALALAAAAWLGASGYLAANVVVVGLVGVLAWRTLHVDPPARGEAREFVGPALRLSVPLLPVALAQWALFSIDSLLIYEILDKSATGAYSAAYSISAVGLLIPLGLQVVWPASSQRLLARSRQELRRMTTLFAGIVVGAGLFLVLASVACEPLLRKILHNPAYADVPQCVPWIITGFVALGLAKLFEGIVYAMGNNRYIVASYAVGVAANVGLNALWIPKYGIVGAAYANAAGYALLAACLLGSLGIVMRLDNP
jgi:O-antigen/teichoic acid export membrane protein